MIKIKKTTLLIDYTTYLHKKFLLITILTSSFCFAVNAQQIEVYGARKNVRTSGDILVSTIPAACLITTLSLQDWKGLRQGAFTGLLTVGAGCGLKYIVDKERPDKSNNMSFPSLHTGVSFAGATFIQRRYGWEWGIPTYAVAAYVGWSRVYGKKHDWVDVTAGAVLGIGSAYLFTRPFTKKNNHQTTYADFSTNTGNHTHGNSNNLWGVTAGTALGIGSAFMLAKIFAQKENITITPVAGDQYIGLFASLNF